MPVVALPFRFIARGRLPIRFATSNLKTRSTMNHFHSKLPMPRSARMGSQIGLIEWEELPSLAKTLAQRMSLRGGADFQNSSSFGSVWDATLPAPLDMVREPEPFREALEGLATRELHEPDVFRHFFLQSN